MTELLCVDRGVPIVGRTLDGNSSDKTSNNAILSRISGIMARKGLGPGAFVHVADSTMVTEKNLAAMGSTASSRGCRQPTPPAKRRSARLSIREPGSGSGSWRRTLPSPGPAQRHPQGMRGLRGPVQGNVSGFGRPLKFARQAEAEEAGQGHRRIGGIDTGSIGSIAIRLLLRSGCTDGFGAGALDAAGLLRTYKGQYGVESDFALLEDPLVVNDLFLKTSSRIDGFGMVLIIALMVWRLTERAMPA